MLAGISCRESRHQDQPVQEGPRPWTVTPASGNLNDDFSSALVCLLPHLAGGTWMSAPLQPRVALLAGSARRLLQRALHPHTLCSSPGCTVAVLLSMPPGSTPSGQWKLVKAWEAHPPGPVSTEGIQGGLLLLCPRLCCWPIEGVGCGVCRPSHPVFWASPGQDLRRTQ